MIELATHPKINKIFAKIGSPHDGVIINEKHNTPAYYVSGVPTILGIRPQFGSPGNQDTFPPKKYLPLW